MNRFYCASTDVAGDTIIIRDISQLHHIRDVIKLKEGERVFVLTIKGNEFDCVISRITEASVVFAIKSRLKPRQKNILRLLVACAIPKHSKIDDIIDTLSQLGVSRIIPMLTERVIARPQQGKREQRVERWRKIALAASKQSQRNSVPIVDEITDVKDVIASSGDFCLKLLPTLPGERMRLKDVLACSRPPNVLVLIGPEGDFTPQEILQAQKERFIAVSFGDFVFRVETACAYIASVLQYTFE